jgi:hypothetical protein
VKSHEQRAEQNTERTGERCGGEAEAHAGADKANRNGKKLEIAEKPERPLVDGFAMALGSRNIVDGPGFYA